MLFSKNTFCTLLVLSDLMLQKTFFKVVSCYQEINLRTASFSYERRSNRIARYVSNKDFLSKCIKSKIFWKGVQLFLEQIIGNLDQELINGTQEKGFLLH